MKKVIILLCICGILCAGFFAAMHYIEEKQSDSSLQIYSVTLEELQKKYGEGTSFRKILPKVDYGDFQELALMEFCIKNTDFTDTTYSYGDAEIINGIQGVFDYYGYYPIPEEITDGDIELLWNIKLYGSNNIVLSILAYQINDNRDVIALIMETENMGRGILEGSTAVEVYADYAVSEKMIEYLEKNTGTMSLELARQKILSIESELPLTEFFNMRHTYKETYSRNESNDHYNVYIQPLSDYDGYLEIYSVERYYVGTVGRGDSRRCVFIFKINLYDNAGNLQEELFSDMEKYYRDR